MGARINPNARFERAKEKAQQQERSQQQLAQEAIKRKFAAQGMQGSGADIKITKQVQEEGSKRLSGRLGDIEAAQQDEAFRQQQIEDQRAFQRGEREASQQFAGEQSALARKQQASQFAEQLGLSKEQFTESMGFQRDQFNEAKNQFQKQFDQQLIQFDWQKGISAEQTKMAKQAAALAQEQFDFTKQTENFNAVQSVLNQFLKPGQTLNESQVDALLGVMGPEILGAFPDIKELITGGPSAPAAGGAADASGGQFVRGTVGSNATIGGVPVRFEQGSQRNPIYRDSGGNRYQKTNGQWQRI